MATLGGGHRTRTLVATLRGGHQTVQIARSNLHNLIGDPDACPELYTTMIELRDTTHRLGHPSTQEAQALGYQAPKSNKLLNFSLPRITMENSNRCNRCHGKSTRSAQVPLSQIPPQQQKLWRNMRGRTRRTQRTPRPRSPRFPSLRGESDWWKYGSRSPLSFPSRRSKNHWRD